MKLYEWNEIIQCAKDEANDLNTKANGHYISVETEHDVRGEHIIRLNLFDACGKYYRCYVAHGETKQEYISKIEDNLQYIVNELGL